MERVYTPAEMATALAHFERIIQRQKESQHRYYERNAEAKKAYAKDYYQRKKAAAVAVAGGAEAIVTSGSREVVEMDEKERRITTL
jgi:ATP-dependent protease HslVU (ClpYQ) peptidase subunit